MIQAIQSIIFLTLFLSVGPLLSNPRHHVTVGKFKEYGGRRLELVAKFIPSDPIIFEAGGHYGEDTVKLANRWPQGHVISFEPNPAAYIRLLQTVKKTPNISHYNLAVNTYNGDAILNVCYGTTGDQPIFEGASSLLEASDHMKIHYKGPKVKIPCVVLDDWCKENNVDHIDFMWLDLEGLELQTLESSPEILKTVKVIYTETNFHPFRKGTTQYQALESFLKKSGFELAAHWYDEGLQGDAVFVKKTVYDNYLIENSL